MGYPSYEERKLEATAYDHQAYSLGYREGYEDGYAIAVQQSYPEIATFCSAHRVFDSNCERCVGE